MKLNEDIWLAESERGVWWQAQSVGTYLNNNPFYASIVGEYNGAPLGSLSNLYRKRHSDKYGHLIDNSFAYAAIPANSPLSFVNYVNKTSALGGLYTTYQGDIPLGLCAYTQELSAVDGGTNRGINEVYHYLIQDRWGPWSETALNNADYTSENVNVAGGGSTYVITDYNYNDIVLLVRVVAYNADYTSRQIQDLSIWETEYKSTHPNVTCVFCVPYLGKTGARVSLDGKFLAVDRSTYDITATDGRIGCLRNIELKLPPNYTALNNYHYQGVWNAPENADTLISYDAPNLRTVRGFTIGHYTPDFVYYTNTTIDDFSNNSDTWYRAGAALRIAYGDPDLFTYRAPSSNMVFTTLKDPDSIRSLVAWYGLQFVADRIALQGEAGDADFYVPIIGEDGYTTGEYRDGEDAAELPNADWGEDFHEKNGYDGKSSEQFDMETELNSNTRSAASPFTKRYICTIQNLIDLKAYLFQTLAPSLTAIEDSYKTFLTNNPIDCISSVVMFPFNIQDYIPAPPLTASIIIGNADTGIAADYFYLSQILVIDGGSVEYRDKYKDFRSYEPYCDAELHIPYHGSVHITPSEFVGHQIGVKFLVDITSGASLALIYRDGLVIDSIAGQLGASIPITGVQTASYLNAVYNASAAYKQAKASQFTQTASALLGGLAAGISGNPLGAVMSVASGALRGEQSDLSIEQAKYNLDHVQVPYKTIGTNTPFTSIGNEQYCRLIIKRPIMQAEYKPELYAHTTGFACCITAKLGSVSGYTVIAAADLSGLQISAAEKQQLLRLLQSGIFM